jgi:hypothetical protein
MTKAQILAEIRRTAARNDGSPLGRARFLAETGIRESDWAGKYWVRWNDAIREAGFTPNKLTAPLAGEYLLKRLCEVARELHHFPLTRELMLKSRADPTFPNAKTFDRLGPKASRVAAVLEFARQRGYQDVVEICAAFKSSRKAAEDADDDSTTDNTAVGYVYLARHGSARQFKIGRTNNPFVEKERLESSCQSVLSPFT